MNKYEKLLIALSEYVQHCDDKNLDAFLAGYAGDEWEEIKLSKKEKSND